MTKRSVTKKPKLTKWFDGRKFVPYHVGEYIASTTRDSYYRRWWNGSNWSATYHADDPDWLKYRYRFMIALPRNIHFRGLAQNPEVQP